MASEPRRSPAAGPAEAVEAAQSMSTDDSAGFINGILVKIAQTKGVAH
ncbi:transcription antitermination factor NusB [Subtercola boreus]|nr:transcription antitermination factor NusB [Subtercola boreus]